MKEQRVTITLTSPVGEPGQLEDVADIKVEMDPPLPTSDDRVLSAAEIFAARMLQVVDKDARGRCPECGGCGRVFAMLMSGDPPGSTIPCNACNGTGRVSIFT